MLTTKKACERLGVHAQTLRRWDREGRIRTIRTPGGQRLYDLTGFTGDTACIVYCRVSSPKQKEDLNRQVEFMRKRYPQADVITDVGSGINFKRKGLKTILERAMRGDKLKVMVAHRDRLCRFGFELVKWIIEKNGGELVVLNDKASSPEDELTQDLLSILHVFSCRMHGLRNYKKQVSEAISNERPEESI